MLNNSMIRVQERTAIKPSSMVHMLETGRFVITAGFGHDYMSRCRCETRCAGVDHQVGPCMMQALPARSSTSRELSGAAMQAHQRSKHGPLGGFHGQMSHANSVKYQWHCWPEHARVRVPSTCAFTQQLRFQRTLLNDPLTRGARDDWRLLGLARSMFDNILRIGCEPCPVRAYSLAARVLSLFRLVQRPARKAALALELWAQIFKQLTGCPGEGTSERLLMLLVFAVHRVPPGPRVVPFMLQFLADLAESSNSTTIKQLAWHCIAVARAGNSRLRPNEADTTESDQRQLHFLRVPSRVLVKLPSGQPLAELCLDATVRACEVAEFCSLLLGESSSAASGAVLKLGSRCLQLVKGKALVLGTTLHGSVVDTEAVEGLCVTQLPSLVEVVSFVKTNGPVSHSTCISVRSVASTKALPILGARRRWQHNAAPRGFARPGPMAAVGTITAWVVRDGKMAGQLQGSALLSNCLSWYRENRPTELVLQVRCCQVQFPLRCNMAELRIGSKTSQRVVSSIQSWGRFAPDSDRLRLWLRANRMFGSSRWVFDVKTLVEGSSRLGTSTIVLAPTALIVRQLGESGAWRWWSISAADVVLECAQLGRCRLGCRRRGVIIACSLPLAVTKAIARFSKSKPSDSRSIDDAGAANDEDEPMTDAQRAGLLEPALHEPIPTRECRPVPSAPQADDILPPPPPPPPALAASRPAAWIDSEAPTNLVDPFECVQACDDELALIVFAFGSEIGKPGNAALPSVSAAPEMPDPAAPPEGLGVSSFEFALLTLCV
jgi:hypothetical protein